MNVELLKKNRWLVVLGALLIQVSLGAIYIYGVFKQPLKENFPDWSATDLALPSQLVLAFFAVSMVIAGRLQDKLGPRLIAAVGGLLLGVGLIVASLASDLMTFTLGFSVIGGLGIGSAYVCPLATCVKWYPDRRGLITGLAVAGFGAGALVFTPVAKSLVASQGIMTTFMILGILFAVAVVIGSLFMVNPPAGFKPEGWNPPAPAAGAAAAKADYTLTEMLATPQFWLLWVTYFAGCTAGLMIIMNVTNIWQSVEMVALAGAAPVAKDRFAEIAANGAGAVMIVAILNSLGRIVWGKVSDSLGRKGTLLIMFVLSAAVMMVLNWLTGYALYLTGVSLVGFCFGGFLAIYPAVTADYFGTKNIGVNYGAMFSAYGAGGLFGPWLAPKLMEIVASVEYEAVNKATQAVDIKKFDAGNYMTSFVISGVMCLLALGIVALIKPPKAKG